MLLPITFLACLSAEGSDTADPDESVATFF